jgi:hypothetical protein
LDDADHLSVGAPLRRPRARQRHEKRFCSLACQRAAERQGNIERWLRTGQASAIGGRGHYIRRYLFDEQTGRCAVCPNCDSQHPTFKSRNRGNGRAWRRQRYADGKSY